MHAAVEVVVKASERRGKLEKIIAETKVELKRRKEERKGRSGRMKKAEQVKEDALKDKLSRAEVGLLPDDPREPDPLEKQLVQAAALHAQDHTHGV